MDISLKLNQEWSPMRLSSPGIRAHLPPFAPSSTYFDHRQLTILSFGENYVSLWKHEGRVREMGIGTT
jgi:hypothetical protein